MDRVIGYDPLWESSMKRRAGVGWKPSTKHYNINAVTETFSMYRKLKTGEWKNGKPKEIQIMYPKKRDGLSIRFKDRVYQGSINDNILYPSVQKSFIFDNMACQKGKGPDLARERLKKHLRSHYSRYGTEGYVLQVDVKGYYPNMRHDVVKNKFRRYLNDDAYKAVCDVLDYQYKGEIGYYPGSQMVQIAGIALLDDLDHMCKERLRIKHYMRYMDDILVIHHSRTALEECLEAIRAGLAKLGFEVHEDKTHIIRLSKGFTFLGFEYRVTSTGKVLMTLNSANIKHERKKLVRLVKLAKEGQITKAKADECFADWCEHAGKGNSYKLLTRMRRYYDDLWRDKA